jgi:hypothetical protein
MSRFDKDFSKAYGKKRFSESDAQSGWERLGPELDAEFPLKGSGGGGFGKSNPGQSTLLAVAIGLTMSIISIGSQVQSPPYFEDGALSTSISQTEVSQTEVSQTNVNQSNLNQSDLSQTQPSSNPQEGKTLNVAQDNSEPQSMESKSVDSRNTANYSVNRTTNTETNNTSNSTSNGTLNHPKKNNTTLESDKTQKAQESNIEETIPVAGSTAGVLASNPPAVGLSEDPEAMTLAMADSRNTESVENSAVGEVKSEIAEEASKSEEIDPTIDEPIEESNKKLETVEELKEEPTEDKVEVPTDDPNKTLERNAQVLVQKPSHANRSKFYVGVQGAGLSQNRNLSGATNLWVSERNAKETVNPALSLGLTLGWAWNENWSVQLGVNHLQWTEDMNYPLSEETDTAFHDSRWGRPQDFYNDIVYIDSARVVDSIYVGHYVYNLTYRTIDSNDVPLNRTQQFAYVQLPISVEYTYLLGAWRPYASGGVILGFPSQKSAVYRGVYETVPFGYSFSNIQYSVAGQVGIGYAFDSHWSLRAYGTYSQNLNSTFSTSQLSQSYARWGGGFGVRFTW